MTREPQSGQSILFVWSDRRRFDLQGNPSTFAGKPKDEIWKVAFGYDR
jgi:hypothetical protein